jgi:hypothetical protein
MWISNSGLSRGCFDNLALGELSMFIQPGAVERPQPRVIASAPAGSGIIVPDRALAPIPMSASLASIKLPNASFIKPVNPPG